MPPAPFPLTAWLVHAYTASGAAVAFLGTLAVLRGDYRSAFLWMLVATVIDSTDGWLARLARVRDRLPDFDGARLDDIVDYLAYVFLPVILVSHARLLPGGWDVPVLLAVLLASAYGFSREDAKSADHFFTGFPSYWNVVAFYLYAGGLPPAANAAVLLVLAVFVFVPIGYVYPSRTPVLRRTTITLCAVWGVLLVGLILGLPDARRELLAISLLFPLYYVALSLALHRRRLS